jgi:hypothetical protein
VGCLYVVEQNVSLKNESAETRKIRFDFAFDFCEGIWLRFREYI